MKSRITTDNLLLTGLNTGEFFSLEKAGRTSFQPIGTVTGTVKLQFSNDKTNFFDLLTGLDVSKPFVIETTDYLFYKFVVTTIGTGTVKWSISNSDTVSGGGGGGGASSLTLYGLSTNDYTNTEKSKLAGIQSGAEVNVQADWSESSPSSDAYIQNKPTIPSPTTLHSDLTLDDGTNPHGTTKTDVGLSNVPNVDTSTTANISDTTAKRFVSDTEKTEITHSNRSVLDLITEAFTTALKTAYDSTVTWVSTNGANVLSHLSSTSNPHSVTKTQVGLSNVPNVDTSTTANITDSTNKRFVTDAQQTIISNTSGTNTGDQDLSALMVKSNNLSDLTDATTARSNLGLGTLATQSGTFSNKQDNLLSGVNIKTVEGVSLLGSGNFRLLDETRVFLFNDFVSATALQPFVGGAISTGTIAQNTTNFSANTLGVCRITKSTTANSGYRAVTDANSLRLKGGEVYSVRFMPLNVTTQTFRGGFMDATTVTESVDGVYFQIANSGDLVLKTSNNSVRTTSPVLATLVINTWYKIEVVISVSATSVLMNLYDATGTLISSTAPITTNIPTGAGRETGCGFVSTGSSVTADALLDIDFHYFEQTLTR
jgi:hypothetical protein